MRVISGRFRGLKLDAPPGQTTRPITDRVKESLFNILGARHGMPGALPEMDVLDLFAGSGALGIEALSRGARGCLFVERDRRSLAVLRGNLARLKLGDQCRVVTDNAWTLRVPVLSDAGFGLMFVDPPFRDVEATLRVIDLLDRLAPRLSDGGVIVLRHDVRTGFSPDGLRELRVSDDRRMGRNRLLLLARPAGHDVARHQDEEEEPGTGDVGQNADREFVAGDRAGEGVADGQQRCPDDRRPEQQGQ